MTRRIRKSLTVACQPRALADVRSLLNQTLTEAGVEDSAGDALRTAIHDVVSSMVSYAGYKKLTSEISLTFDVNDVRFKATMADSLNAFELQGAPGYPQFQERLEQERAHAPGILGMRQSLDEISYTYRKGLQNELELVKFLQR